MGVCGAAFVHMRIGCGWTVWGRTAEGRKKRNRGEEKTTRNMNREGVKEDEEKDQKEMDRDFGKTFAQKRRKNKGVRDLRKNETTKTEVGAKERVREGEKMPIKEESVEKAGGSYPRRCRRRRRRPRIWGYEYGG